MSFAGRVCELAVTTCVITDWNKFSHPVTSITKIVSEYDQEIPQSQTADNPVAPRGRATQPSQDHWLCVHLLCMEQNAEC